MYNGLQFLIQQTFDIMNKGTIETAAKKLTNIKTVRIPKEEILGSVVHRINSGSFKFCIITNSKGIYLKLNTLFNLFKKKGLIHACLEGPRGAEGDWTVKFGDSLYG